jgi:hypothetical protein
MKAIRTWANLEALRLERGDLKRALEALGERAGNNLKALGLLIAPGSCLPIRSGAN